MELIISEIIDNENKLVPVRLTNFETLEKEIITKMDEFKSMKFTKDNLKLAKDYRANLNKFKKAIDDRKIAIYKEIEEKTGYNELYNQCKILTGYVEEASKSIDIQIKDFETIEKNTKLQEILQYWIENAGEYSEIVDVDKLVKEQCFNKTYSINKVHDDIDHIITRTRTDFAVLENASNDKELVKRLKDYYLNNINSPSVLTLTMQEKQRIEESNKKIETLENSQNITKSEVNIINSPQNLTNSELIQVDFRVWVTKSQGLAIREFLINNKIKFGNVPKNEK